MLFHPERHPLKFHHIVLERSDFLGENNELCVAITSLRIQRDRAGVDTF